MVFSVSLWRIPDQAMSSPDVIVVGGGLAGTSAAIRLARANREVLLLERETEAHHKVCGEFLSFEAQAYLNELGVDLPNLGAVAINRLRLLRGGSSVVTVLPFGAMSLSRYVLDEVLLEHAQAAGVTVCRGTTVNGLSKTENCWTVKASSSRHQRTSFDSQTVLLASGKHDLRGHQRPSGMQNNLIGFKMHFLAAENEFDDCVDVVMFRGGYAGLEKIEGDKLNLCLLIDKERYAGYGKNWSRLLADLQGQCPALAQRLNGAQPCWAKPLAVSSIPYGFVQNAPAEDGLYRIGDQVAVIPSFCGNGMSIALHTASTAVQHYLRDSKDYQQTVATELRTKVRAATLLSSAAVTPFYGPLIFAACRTLPGLMNTVATKTRLSSTPGAVQRGVVGLAPQPRM